MTITPPAPSTANSSTANPRPPASTAGPAATGPIGFELVALDLYRDIHKGIRTELFSVTTLAGRLDPADRDARVGLASRVHGVVDLLLTHAEHEDGAIQPVLEAELPALAEQVAAEHTAIEATMEGLEALAADAAAADAASARTRSHHLYLDLARFTATYLEHQDVEERVVMPRLEATVGLEVVAEINHAIISKIPPDQMATSLSLMLPAMNLEDRVELLGGMQAGAPPEAFAQIWGLAGVVLVEPDVRALGSRLGLS